MPSPRERMRSIRELGRRDIECSAGGARGVSQGEVPHLYAWHRQLSGISSHVTGLSVLRGVIPVEGENPAAELAPMQRKMHLMMMMAGATLQGCLQHGGMLNDVEAMEATIVLLTRLSDLSFKWPGSTTKRRRGAE